ncbi:DUF1664 domain-containing protein [Halosolutus gelatinilyticus]|uniref:DUF1664 domain-containing protein n=1 Tax=Halosolutus gelatinilyticus TaxID=2931975 RepID=UPI001FF576DB|nr:DUF1664 domain-containing protein [Halosolutus gelatinilyticus]
MAVDSEDAPSGESSAESIRSSEIERVDRKQEDMYETLRSIRDGAANEQVEELADLLETMVSELCRLEARNRLLTTRLHRVETINGLSGDEIDLSDASTLDHRDEKVVKAIVADGRKRLTLSDLHELYRGHTDV